MRKVLRSWVSSPVVAFPFSCTYLSFFSLFFDPAANQNYSHSFLTVIEPRYQRHAKKVAPNPPKPEKRLELCVISGFSLVIAMFWFGWTSYSSIHWISPVLAGGLIGVGVLGMFVSLFNYIIDVYLWSAASALASASKSLL